MGDLMVILPMKHPQNEKIGMEDVGYGDRDGGDDDDS